MSLKAYIEELKDLKQVCTIRFVDVQGMEVTIRGHIIRTEEVSGREIIETDAGFVIGIDQIVSINDRPGDNYC